jgi:hypothetical protein
MPSERVERHEPESDVICSARSCRARARWALRWNNPTLHTPERRKTWLACEEHRASLSEHLNVRGFLREVEPAPGSPAEPLAGLVSPRPAT